ncbi:MAG: ABC transporter ATP-binding protein [Dehalococcoidia bacterium]|nr:ABC transporter ATP-binding protein [Dehalococcoidia bacterium]MCA9852627.1 ABC transporter ATP-binding protein [Dehalococcoidia bacterium]
MLREQGYRANPACTVPALPRGASRSDQVTDISTVDAGPLLPAQGSGRPSYQIEIEHLTKRYGRRAVVDDLTFTVQPGRVTGFLGPNGSGKSTTMKILLGLASATEGKATIGGQFYRDLRDPAGTVGVLIEQDSFHPGRSGRDHLQILSDVAGVGAARVSEILSLVGLKGDDARRHVGTYSLGMRQRLSLAAALLCDPPVLVLDEPGNGLDPQGVRTLRNLLRARAANGDTVLVSSHALAEAEHLVDDLVVIDQGRLVTTGSMHDLRQAASLVRTTSPTQLRDILETAGAVATLQGTDSLIVSGLPIDEIGERAFAAGIVVHELSTHAGSLEDLFLAWTGGRVTDEALSGGDEVMHL